MHTRLPWSISQDWIMAGEDRVCTVDGTVTSQCEPDVEYIVRAANNFPAMLEALKLMVREFGQFGRKLNVKKDFHKLVAIEAARTAIAAAEKE